MDTFKNPLETVQLIPIFSYLSILSDFLYIERYLTETEQNKPIPIVNGLYDYLQDNENKKEKIVLLIRNLLKGSDLYGAKENEYFDVTFVNVMFDYIITSLVFEKYGNIYGFLADIFLRVENLQFDRVMNVIITKLENESFENEDGQKSMLSILAVNRIYNDIILPLYPQPKTNLGLLSLDYIYAQAGCTFLRAGQINNTYYIDFPNMEGNATDENLFDQYLVTGHVIERLILSDGKNLKMIKSFAFPALLYYIFSSKFLFGYENMAKEVSNANFWQTAYKHLFEYTSKSFDDIEYMLQNDYRFKMHMALSNFQNCFVLAQSILEEHCPHLDPAEVDSSLRYYLFHPKSFHCKDNQQLPDPNEYFERQINSITELFELYNIQLVENAFPNYLKMKFEYEDVNIKLLVPYNMIKESEFSNSAHLAYNLLKVYSPRIMSNDYYVLYYKDYTLTMYDETDNSTNYTEDIKLYFQQLKNLRYHIILKESDDNMSVFFRNFINYKKSRLETNLKILNNCQGEDRQMKFNWWKEFGLSLVPNMPCLIATSDISYGRSCISRGNEFFFRYPNHLSSQATHVNTQFFMNSFDTTIKSVFLRNASREAVDEILTEEEEYIPSTINALDRKQIFEEISLKIQDPAYQLSFITKHQIGLLENIINNLQQKTRLIFTTVTSSLSKITILQSNFYRSIGKISENSSRLIYVNTLNNQSDTGYGYKFIFTSDNEMNIAHLRTCYELKDERFLSPIEDSKEGKIYSSLNNVTFRIEPDHFMYLVNNQLRRRPTKLLFSGLVTEPDDLDENCSDYYYFKNWESHNRCQRTQRYWKKFVYESEAVEHIQKKKNLSEEDVSNMLAKYTFPNNETLVSFANEFIKSSNCQEPNWATEFIIDNPNLLSRLRYNTSFESHSVSNYDGEFRINSFYSKAERHKIEEEESLKSIIESYNEQMARFSVTFHDYYAIRNFASTGYTRISGDTNEAKLMQLALYKLAIRQSDDPDDSFDLKLFRVETKPTSFLQTLSTNKYITLQKFTQAYPNATSAVRFSGYPLPGFVNILYEMIFYGPYPRAKIEQIYKEKEHNVILLPETKFRINDNTTVKIGGLGNVFKLQLKFQIAFNNKYIWYKDIMQKIARINF